MLDEYQYPYQLVYWREQDVGTIPENVITEALRYSFKAPNQATELERQVIWLPHRDTNTTMSTFTTWAAQHCISNTLTNATIERCEQAVVFGAKDPLTWYDKFDVWSWIRNNAQNALLQAYRFSQYMQKAGYCTGFNGKILHRQTEFLQDFTHLTMYPIVMVFLGVNGIIAHKSTQKTNIDQMTLNDTDSFFDAPLAGDVTPDMGYHYEWDSENKTIGAMVDSSTLERAPYKY